MRHRTTVRQAINSKAKTFEQPTTANDYKKPFEPQSGQKVLDMWKPLRKKKRKKPSKRDELNTIPIGNAGNWRRNTGV